MLERNILFEFNGSGSMAMRVAKTA